MALSAAWIVLSACSKNNAAVTTNEVEQKLKVEAREVKVQDVEQLYEYTAIVKANVVNNIAPTIAGRINRIYVEVGDRVSEGQKLITMDDNNLEQAKTQLANLELNFKRIDELYKVGGVSKSDWDAQKTALDVARTSYNNLLTNTALLSPISGVVTMRNYDSGDIYAGNPILQVQQITPVKMLINVSENQFTKIKTGMEVNVKLDVYGDEIFKGKVSLVYPTINSQTHTFPVEITLPNKDSRVRPGMYARVIVNMGMEQHVVVPDVAIVKQQGSGDRYVFVYTDGKVSYDKVVLGRRMGDTYELISGVNDGALVVTTGLNKLNNGMEVELVK
jgi:RND family efflux transporter MFP subunit